MNTIYYIITRKIIRPFFVSIGVIFRSIFYMSCIAILITIPTVIFSKHIFLEEVTTEAVIILIGLVLFGFLFVIRLLKQIDTYDIRDEPKFVEDFITDCFRSDNKLEEEYKQAKEAKIQKKKEIAQEKQEAKQKKREVKERINHRSDILDL